MEQLPRTHDSGLVLGCPFLWFVTFGQAKEMNWLPGHSRHYPDNRSRTNREIGGGNFKASKPFL
jgi:hypothetical protein